MLDSVMRRVVQWASEGTKEAVVVRRTKGCTFGLLLFRIMNTRSSKPRIPSTIEFT